MTEQNTPSSTHPDSIELAESIIEPQSPWDIDPESVRDEVMDQFPNADPHLVKDYVYDRMWYRRGAR